MPLPRPSYTLANALRFKPFFDSYLTTGTNLLSNNFGINDGTFWQRISDALLYLAREEIPGQEVSKFKREDYLNLKLTHQLRRVNGGMKLWPKYAALSISKTAETLVNPNTQTNFEVLNMELRKFMEDSDEHVYNVEGLKLSRNEVDNLIALLTGTGYEFLIREDCVRVVKG
jgi:hypothetical protein